MPGIRWRRRVPQWDGTPEREVRTNSESAGAVITTAELWSVPGWAQILPPRPLLEGFPFTIDREFVRALPARQTPYRALQTLEHLVSSAAPGGVVEDFLRPTLAFEGEEGPRTPPAMPLRPRVAGRSDVRDEAVVANVDEANHPNIVFGDEAAGAPLIGEARQEEDAVTPGPELPVVRVEPSGDRYAAAMDVAVQRPTPLRVLPTPDREELANMLAGDRPGSGVRPELEAGVITDGIAGPAREADGLPQDLEPPDEPMGDAGQSELTSLPPDAPDGLTLQHDVDGDEPATVPIETEASSDVMPTSTGSTPAVGLGPTAGGGPAYRGIENLPLAVPEDGPDGPSWTTVWSSPGSSPAGPVPRGRRSSGPDRDATAIRRGGLGRPLPGLPQSAVPVLDHSRSVTSDADSRLSLADFRAERGGETQAEQELLPTVAVRAVALPNRELVAPPLPDLEDLSPSPVQPPIVIARPLPSVDAPPMSLPTEPPTQPVTADDAVRGQVESRVGLDLSGVRVDRSMSVTAQAQDLDAEAFTDDSGVHLPPTASSATSPQARGLLAHELTHAAQRRRLGNRMPEEDSPAGRHLEAEAVAVERAIATAPITPPRGALPLPQPGSRAPGDAATATPTPQGMARVATIARAALGTLAPRRSMISKDELAAGTAEQVATYAQEVGDRPSVAPPGILMSVGTSEAATPAARIDASSEPSAPSLGFVEAAGTYAEPAGASVGVVTAGGLVAPPALHGEPMLLTERSLQAPIAKAVAMPVATPAPANPVTSLPNAAAVFGQPLVAFDPGVQQQPSGAGMDLATPPPSTQLFGETSWTSQAAPASAPAGMSTSPQASSAVGSGSGSGFGDVVQRKSKSSRSSKSSKRSKHRPEKLEDSEVDLLVDQILPVITYRLRSELRRERGNTGSLTGFF